LAAVEASLDLEPLLTDGTVVRRGDNLARVTGSIRGILTAERTALNFLQRMSGVASLTRLFVDAVAGLPCRIPDTRKTVPGWRLLDKYAVRCGGGHNHRLGLYDGVLIKDNHLAALGCDLPAIATAIRAARAGGLSDIPLEIEADRLDQFDIALSCA